MAESKNDLTENKKKRPNKLTNARIKKEIEFLEKMFVGVDDENKKTLINSLIEEAAFLKVACFQAKEELKKEGLTPLTQSVAPGYYLLPCSLPCGGLIKALCIFFHGPTALSVNGLWVMCIATP